MHTNISKSVTDDDETTRGNTRDHKISLKTTGDQMIGNEHEKLKLGSMSSSYSGASTVSHYQQRAFSGHGITLIPHSQKGQFPDFDVHGAGCSPQPRERATTDPYGVMCMPQRFTNLGGTDIIHDNPPEDAYKTTEHVEKKMMKVTANKTQSTDQEVAKTGANLHTNEIDTNGYMTLIKSQHESELDENDYQPLLPNTSLPDSDPDYDYTSSWEEDNYQPLLLGNVKHVRSGSLDSTYQALFSYPDQHAQDKHSPS